MMDQMFPVKSIQNTVVSGNEVFNNDLIPVFTEQPKPKRRPGRPKGSKNKVKRAPTEKKKRGRKRKRNLEVIPNSVPSLHLPLSDVSSAMIQSNSMPLDLPLDGDGSANPADSLLSGPMVGTSKQARSKGKKTSRKGKQGSASVDSFSLLAPVGEKESSGDPPIEQLARKGTLKYRNQIRQLMKKHDAETAAENEARQKLLFEDNTSFDPNLFMDVKDPNVQTSSRKNSLDTLSLSFV